MLRKPPLDLAFTSGVKSRNPEDSGLNADGSKRAQCLRDVFGVNSPYDIGYIVAPRPNRYGQHRRSFETVLPLAIGLEYPEDRFDLIWTVPFPYDHITDFRSEGCPGLDTRSLLQVQG
ncbi:putative phosphoglycerate mutase family protein [Aspergillus lentulus]|nr:putative phosphoglycerate mutase family protein [Aspergillus lentulus]